MWRQIGFDLLKSGMRFFCKAKIQPVPPGMNPALIILGQIQLIEQALRFAPSVQETIV